MQSSLSQILGATPFRDIKNQEQSPTPYFPNGEPVRGSQAYGQEPCMTWPIAGF